MHKQVVERAAGAFRRHQYDEALKLYKQLLDCGDSQAEIVSFQNAGVCLRRLKRDDEALALLKQGVLRYPEAPGIHRNIGNIYRDKGGDARLRAIYHYRKAQSIVATDADVLRQAVVWNELGFSVLAYKSIYDYFMSDAEGRRIEELGAVELVYELTSRLFDKDQGEIAVRWCLEYVLMLAEDNHQGYFAAAKIYAGNKDPDNAISCYRKGVERLRQAESSDLVHNDELVKTSWNLACTLLRNGMLQCGWELYEFGLCAPTDTPQRWQRALQKTFSFKEVPVWQGEDISGKKLLVIGEQAVGDTMMFLSLLKQLEKRKCTICVAVQDRLVSIYQRTLEGIEVLDSEKMHQARWEFDFQVPCGSLPRHLLADHLKEGSTLTLLPDPEMTNRLRARYCSDQSNQQPLIGISWLGGGRGDRLRMKSIRKKEFTDFLKSTKAKFVSLQYGNIERDIAEWRSLGIDVVHDAEIDPLKDMDAWLSQVACCDMVISVANTTIHGSGGLGIPTACLLSRNSDWRWVIGSQKSYWYDSVDCFNQDSKGSWAEALSRCSAWITDQLEGQPKRAFDPSLVDFTYSLYDDDK